MFYFCGEQFIAFKIVKCEEIKHKDSVLFLFKDNNRLLLTMREINKLIDASTESCKNPDKLVERQVITNHLGEQQEVIEISKLTIFYKRNYINVLELEELKTGFASTIGFEFNFSESILYDWNTATNVLFQDESVNVAAFDERVVSYINKFYFDLAKVKIYDMMTSSSPQLWRLDLNGD